MIKKSNAMLIVKQDKTRKEEEGQIFVELTIYRDVRNIADCNRLGYWCDKAHLSHFIMECAKCFTQDELKNILKMNGNNIYIEKNNLLDAYKKGNADNKKMLWIPEGFAHGFVVLSDVAEFCYKCTDVYDPTAEGGIPYDDPTVNVQWPDCGCEHKTSAKDKEHTPFAAQKFEYFEKY